MPTPFPRFASGPRALAWCLTALLIGACGGGSSTPPGGNATGGTTGVGTGGTTGGTGGVSAGTGGVSGGSGGSGGMSPGTGGNVSNGSGGATTDGAPPVDGNSAEHAPQSDCPAGALMCDDFEGYAAGATDLSPTWSSEVILGKVVVDASKPFKGGKSVHLTTMLSPAGEPMRTNGGPLRAATLVKQGAPLFPLPGNGMWGRAMVWVTKMPPAGVQGDVHSSHIEASGKLANGRLAKYGEGIMGGQLLAGYTQRPAMENDLPLVDCGPRASPGIPEARWVCVEWQIDGAKNAMHMWFDGKLQTQVDVNGAMGGTCTWQAPPFDKLFLGWRHSQPSPIDTEMWMDNVVLDSKRVNCPAP